MPMSQWVDHWHDPCHLFIEPKPVRQQILNRQKFGTLPACWKNKCTSLIGSFYAEVPQTSDDLIIMKTVTTPQKLFNIFLNNRPGGGNRLTQWRHDSAMTSRFTATDADANVFHLQMYSSTSRLHFWHLTKQHQWNLQWHRSVNVFRRVWKPRPQHISSQPSRPFEVLLHSRPCVPIDPVLESRSQKSGDWSR